MKKWIPGAIALVLSLALVNCGPKKEETDESMAKIDPFTVDSGSCSKVTNEETKTTLYDGSCQGTFQTIPGSEHTAYSFEVRVNLRVIGSYFQLNLNSINKNYTSGAQIRFNKIGDNATSATVRLNNSALGTVTSYLMSRVDPNDIRITGTIQPTASGTRIVVWNMKDTTSFTVSTALFDSTNPGHFNGGTAVNPSEVMAGLFRGFNMNNTVLHHALFLDTAIPL